MCERGPKPFRTITIMPRTPASRVLGSLLLCCLAACGSQCAPNGDAAKPQGSVQAAEALMKKKELDEAATMLNELTAQPDAKPIAFQRLAEIYVARNDLAKAVKTLRAGLDRDPKAGELSLLLARIYLQKLAQFSDAKAALEQARAGGASEKDVAMLMGTCLGQQNDMEGAEREFQRALAAGAESKVVHYNLSLILIQKKDLVRAKQTLEQVLTEDPKWADAKRELAHVILLSQPDAASVNKALDMLIEIKEELKSDWHLWEYMGDGWLLLGDFDASVQAYTEALRLGRNPKSVEDKYRVAKTKLNEANAKKAAETGASGKPEKDSGESTPKKP